MAAIDKAPFPSYFQVQNYSYYNFANAKWQASCAKAAQS